MLSQVMGSYLLTLPTLIERLLVCVVFVCLLWLALVAFSVVLGALGS
jgi:hypothetical protein